MAKKAKKQLTEIDTINAMRDEIRLILNKYGFINASLTGELEKGEKKWWTLFTIDKENPDFISFSLCSHNIARMYQATRDRMQSVMDDLATRRRY